MNNELKSIRKSKGLTQGDIAKSLQTTVRVVGGWERGDTAFPLEDACSVADFLRCSLDELAGRDWSPGDFADPAQNVLNACYSNMEPDGKDTLIRVAQSLERDTANRISKEGQNRDDKAAMGA